jgi:hypothetical protein
MKGLPRSRARGGAQRNTIIKQTVPVRNVLVTVAGATGVGWGTAVIGGLPQGNILLVGAVSYMQFTGPTSASLVDTFDGDYGIGSTPASDGTITGGDVDIIQSTALGAATAEVSPRVRGTSTGATAGVVLDNTDGSLELNLNLLIDDANISADNIAMRANGELFLSYIVLGDD